MEVFKGEMSHQELQTALGLIDEKHFHTSYLQPALEAKLFEMTIPSKPQSSKQRYRLTKKGKKLAQSLDDPK
ncbi:MAG: Fic family protein [Oligoflexus sp.]